MKKERGIKANPDIDFSQMNVEAFYATLVKIIEKREGVKINYRIVKREDYERENGIHVQERES